jgi:protein tyrosine/serine phosphatase
MLELFSASGYLSANMKSKISVKILLPLLVFTLTFSAMKGGDVMSEVKVRNQEWALPVMLEGVPNLHKITDNIYRSAQPETEGLKNLAKLKIRTVINLRGFHDDKDEAKGTAIRLIDVPINTWDIDDDQVIQVMKELSKPENGPFLIHCKHGADRTGLMSAMYRIIYQGWSKERALDEMRKGGYGYHAVWANIITYIEKADIEKLKKAIQEPAGKTISNSQSSRRMTD